MKGKEITREMVALPILVTICLISRSVHSNKPFYIGHFCGKSTTLPPTTSLSEKLSTQLLSSNSTADFENGSFFSPISLNDQDNSQSQSSIYASYLCRGDLRSAICDNCVSFSTKDVVERCPSSKEAVIWYDECTLRYSDTNFFGSYADHPRALSHSRINFSSPKQLEGFKTTTMSGNMALEAANKESRFRTNETELSAFETLYSMVQCTTDLPAADCVRCIKTGVSSFYPGAKGARVFLPSCTVRYDTYDFYSITASPSPSPAANASSPSPSPAPTASDFPAPVPGPCARKKKKKGIAMVIVGITVPVAVLALLLAGNVRKLLTKDKKNGASNDAENILEFTKSAEPLQYSFSVLQSATDNFSDANKLGQGLFGGVYKGNLSNGQEIAVKRLPQKSGQGVEEISNEIVLIAKLQHKNLVKLLGFCFSGNEKLFVYEYVPNKSLDYFLSDPGKQIQLDWNARYKIIGGIARGLLYLHEDSRPKIIHHNLKPSNILLDANMMPKISDFGMAKFICPEQPQRQSNINGVMGTRGYLAPEAFFGELSVKSDVYSFGVLVLEIISGQKINDFHKSGHGDDLITYAWKKWNEEEAMELMDESLREGPYSSDEVTRCIHMGLLCVQEDIEARPSMSAVILMLSSESVTVPLPINPAFYSTTVPLSHCHGNALPVSVNEVSITEVGPR